MEEAYAQVLPEMQRLAPEAIAAINLDLPAVVTTVLGVRGQLARLRPMIAAELPGFDLARFDAIERYALAAAYAHSQYRIVTRPRSAAHALAAEAAKALALLRSDADALAARGLIDARRLAKLARSQGHLERAFELLALVTLLHEAWPGLAGKTALELAELQQAQALAHALLRALAAREDAPAQLAMAADLRQRAFTLLVTAYDEARRAAVFLRWHEGDADTLVPSLYAGRGRARRKRKAATPRAVEPAEASDAAARWAFGG